MDKQGQRSVKANERVSHREWGQFCEQFLAENLTSTSACSQDVPLASRGQTKALFMFVPASRHQLLVARTLWRMRCLVVRQLHRNPDNPVGYPQRIHRWKQALALCVHKSQKKRVWQAEAPSTERMPVSWAKRSAVKLFRSFRRMAAPASAGAKWKTNWKHVSAHGGQMSANKPLNCSRLWQQDHIVCHQRSTFPFLCLLFVSFSNCDGDCLMLHLRGNRAHFCPEGFADGGRRKNSHLLAFAGKILFPTTFANRAAALFHWETSSSKCRRQRADRVHGGWISLPFSRVITSHCISFMLLHPINTTNNSLSSTVSDSRC